MKEKHAPKSFECAGKDRLSSEPINKWLAIYDEDADFLCGKVSHPSPEFVEEE